MSALPILIISKEGESPRSHTLDSDVSIGRGEGNVIRLEDRAVSRKHVLVRKTSEGVQIEKQSDFAPIRLNGVECTRALIREGDVVEIGPFRMRLDAKKEPVKEIFREAAPIMAAPILAVPTASDATVVLTEAPSDDQLQHADPLPTDLPQSVLGDLSGALTIDGADSSGDLAQPIFGDSEGAAHESRDPGTDIFGVGGEAEEEVLPELNIGFGDAADGSAPDQIEEIGMSPVDEDAATRILKAVVEARLEIQAGLANVESFDLSQNEITIGRGKECDIVLNDKKSSRKNTILVRTGNRYRVKDLGSSNGTYLNGRNISEAELSNDDVIRVGDVEIRFAALNSDYERKKDQFLPVEQSALPEEAPFENSPMISPELSPTQSSIPAPEAVAPAPPEARKGIWGIYDKYFRNFKTLKPMQKLLVVLAVGLFISWYFEDELGLVDKPAPRKAAVVKKEDAKPSVSPDYDALPAEKKAQIDDAIRKATDFLRQQDFDKAIYEVQSRVYPILPDFAQAKEIERYAQEGKRRKDAIEEEVRRKEDEEKLKARIVELEKQTRVFMSQKKYDQAKESFSEILAVDPDNAAVSGWKHEIEAWMEEQARIEQERLVQEEINKRAWDTYNEGFELHKAGKFREAIDLYKKVPELGSSDDVLLRKAKTMIKTCQDSIRDLRDPHLVKAKELEAVPDLAGAFKEFQVATEVDPSHPEGWAGMDRIRDILTERAKILYTEAVIAESYSDFTSAHAKFTEILKMAPEGSLYHQRAQRKLQSYLNFKAADKSAEGSGP